MTRGDSMCPGKYQTSSARSPTDIGPECTTGQERGREREGGERERKRLSDLFFQPCLSSHRSRRRLFRWKYFWRARFTSHIARPACHFGFQIGEFFPASQRAIASEREIRYRASCRPRPEALTSPMKRRRQMISDVDAGNYAPRSVC